MLSFSNQEFIAKWEVIKISSYSFLTVQKISSYIKWTHFESILIYRVMYLFGYLFTSEFG